MRQKGEFASRRFHGISAQGPGFRFFDRERESRRIEEALRKKECMMISGPADIGKTALIQNVIRNLPGDPPGKCLYLTGFKDLQNLLRNLNQALHEAGSPGLRQQLKAEGVSSVNFDSWLKTLPSARLKGILYRAAQSADYRVILDHVPLLTHARAKIIKELFWMRDTPVYLLMRDDQEFRIPQFARFFYWSDRQCLTLGPLPGTSACELLEACIEKFHLSRFDLEGFRAEILELSGGVPGAIVKMCALAADPRYQYGSHIKTKLIHIDYLMSGSSLGYPAGRRGH
jgi:AAA ATPase domain